MARLEADKEDLLREATALTERVELVTTRQESTDSIVAGFRDDGAASFFFGGDPVYHFNAAAELRRAYCDGSLIKAERGQLVALRRVRQQNEVQLVRHELNDAEQSAFLSRMKERLATLAADLRASQFQVIGIVPPEAKAIGRLQEWLMQHDATKIAATPHAKIPAKSRDRHP